MIARKVLAERKIQQTQIWLFPEVQSDLGLLRLQLAMKKPTDLDLHCLSSSMWISIKNLDQVTNCLEIRSGRGILIYSAWQWLTNSQNTFLHCYRQGAFLNRTLLMSFLFLHEKVCCGYSLEAPCWGTSNVFPKCVFHGEIGDIQNRQRDLTTCRDIKRGNTQVTWLFMVEVARD